MIASLDLEQDLKFIVPGLKAKGLISFKNWATTNVVRSFDPYFTESKTTNKEPTVNTPILTRLSQKVVKLFPQAHLMEATVYLTINFHWTTHRPLQTNTMLEQC